MALPLDAGLARAPHVLGAPEAHPARPAVGTRAPLALAAPPRLRRLAAAAVRVPAGAQLNGKQFDLSFGLKNHLSFGSRFPTLRNMGPIQLEKNPLENPLESPI